MPNNSNCTQITPECPVQATILGYYPNLAANIFFASWFFALGGINILQGLYYQTWFYMVAVSCGCICEGIGYVGRIMMHHNPWSTPGFDIQIVCLILGPAFNSAAIYLTLKHIALTFGPEYSFLKPKLYTYIFIIGDFSSLVLQAVGGGIAASANTNSDANLGSNIMLGGISWQVFTLLAFMLLVILYLLRRWAAYRKGSAPLSTFARSNISDIRFQFFAVGVSIAFITIFTRCVYRIIEMAGGWSNSIMRDEPTYIVLDGVMVSIACLAQTLFHPGYCFPQLCSGKRKRRYPEYDENEKVYDDSSSIATPPAENEEVPRIVYRRTASGVHFE